MKKIFILILTLLISLSYLTPVNSDFSPSTHTPSDINGHWAEASVQTLKSLGVMNGYNGVMNPGSIITRGEFTAIITRAFGLASTQNTKQYTDVPESHIFYKNICAATESGLISGFPDSTFRPDNMITREEIMLIISRISTGKTNYKPKFTDIADDYPYYSQLSKICEDKIFSGYPDGSFKPYDKTTRAEAATIVLAALKKYMPQAPVNDITTLTANYLNMHFSDGNAPDIMLTGEALTDREYIRHAYSTAKKLGYNVENKISNIDITSLEQYGPFSILEVSYRITNTKNSLIREYKGKSTVSIITRNSKSLIYSHNTNIEYEKNINLTWEITDENSGYETPGVNIVSPVCFIVSAQAQAGTAKSIGTDHKGNLDFYSTLTHDYVNKARNNGCDVWAMYKSDFTTDTANRFLNNPQMRFSSINLLIENILNFNLEGINFDFENMYPSDRGAYTNHVKEITLIAHTLGAITSVDITKYSLYSANWSMCFDRDSLSRYCDYIILMAYDQHYSTSKTAGPVAGFEWTENSINLTLNEVENSKVVLAMPYYIRYWEVKNSKPVATKAITMGEALNYISQNSATPAYDSKHKMTKYSWKNGDRECVLWLENSDTISRRVQLAKKYGLKGIASWRKGFETPDIWQVIDSELNK